MIFGKCVPFKSYLVQSTCSANNQICISARHFGKNASSCHQTSLYSSAVSRLRTFFGLPFGSSNTKYIESISFLRKSILFKRPSVKSPWRFSYAVPTFRTKFQAFVQNQCRADLFKTLRNSANLHLYRSALLFQSLWNNIRVRVSRSFQNAIKFDRIKQTALLSSIGIFNWDDWSIENEDIKNEIDDMLMTFKKNTHKAEDDNQPIKINFEFSRTIEVDHDWHKVYDKKDLIIWRRKLRFGPDGEILNDLPAHQQPTPAESGTKDATNTKTAPRTEDSHEIFEYKVLGRLNDVTPLEFFHTQIDLDYRKEWDYLVISIDLVEKDKNTNTELIRWMMKFPYPLYPREYVFVRRACIEKNQKILVVVSQGLPECQLPGEHHSKPETNVKPSPANTTSKPHSPPADQHHHSNVKHVPASKKHVQHSQSQHVRVTRYKSNMIILPHSDFDEKGLDYVIQYYDDSKARIPKLAYQWVTASGLPDYTEKLHRATIKAKAKADLSQIFSCCESSSSSRSSSSSSSSSFPRSK